MEALFEGLSRSYKALNEVVAFQFQGRGGGLDSRVD